MTLCIPRRFSIRALYVLVAMVAMSAYIIREYKHLHAAQDEFQRIMANYEAIRVSAMDVVTASKELMTAESDALWISKRAATAAHVERLQYLLAKVQSPTSEAQPQDVRRRVEFIQREIQKYD